MRYLIGLWAAVIVTVTTALAQGDASQKNVYGVDLSPDGENYAVLQQFGDQKAVAIYSVDNPDAQPVAVGLGQVRPGAFVWGGDNHVLVQGFGERTVETTDGLQELKFARWLSIDKNNGEYEQLFNNEMGDDYFYYILDAGRLMSTLPGEDDTALFSRTDIKRQNQGASRLQKGDDLATLALFTANLAKGRIRQQENGNERTIQWVVDANGEALARVDTGASDNVLKIFTRAPGAQSLKLVTEINLENSGIQKISLLGATQSGGALQALVTDNTGKTNLTAMDIATGSIGEPLVDPALGSVTSYEADYRRGNASAAYITEGGLQIIHLNTDDQTNQAALSKALGGIPVAIKSKSDNGTRMIIKSYPAGRSPEYYLYDSETKRLELVAQE